MKQVDNEVEIHAPAERVWQLLTDFTSFPRWNPFMQQVRGEATAGKQLEVTFQPVRALSMRARPIVLKAEPNRELRWREQFLFPGLLDIEHVFTLLPLAADRVRFTQRQTHTGLFSSFPASRRYAVLRRGLRAMNEALKQLAEQPQPAA
jgi:hypothetical protein